MPVTLVESIEPLVITELAMHGFASQALGIGKAARDLGGLRRGGFSLTRSADDGKLEFLHFQKDRERYGVTCHVGWADGASIPAPRGALDWPDPDHAEVERPAYCCPLFTILDASGVRAHARRLEGDAWWLVSAGPIPGGADDDALAAGIVAVMNAQQASARALTVPLGPDTLARFAARIVTEVVEIALPYFGMRLGAKPSI